MTHIKEKHWFEQFLESDKVVKIKTILREKHPDMSYGAIYAMILLDKEFTYLTDEQKQEIGL